MLEPHDISAIHDLPPRRDVKHSLDCSIISNKSTAVNGVFECVTIDFRLATMWSMDLNLDNYSTQSCSDIALTVYLSN